MGSYKKIKEELVYKGAIVDMYKDYIELPNGKVVEWDLVKHNGAAAMLPIDTDGNILLVKQYRNALGRMTLEIPAGGINKGEDPMECATRELEEETGYKSDQVEHLVDIITAIGFSNEIVSIYLAKDLQISKQNLDEDEFIDIQRYTLSDLTQMIIEGKIIDAKTITAVLTYKTKFNL